MPASEEFPQLRPVEAFPVEQDGQRMLVIHDPSGLAAGTMVVPPAAIFILTLLDGQHDRPTIQQAFAEQFGQTLPLAHLNKMLEQLEDAHYLDSPRFAEHLQAMIDAYRASPDRVSAGPESFGADGESLDTLLGKMLAVAKPSRDGRGTRRLSGLIAPHLDFGRGAPCYAEAYATLAAAGPAQRFVILGTNHFGRATSPVATRRNFRTPLGTTKTDCGFLDALEARLGGDLCVHEFDHQREHSIELQVLILQHLFGAENFEIVPVLCHDPCGPTGTAPYDGNGVDLRVFAQAMGEQIRADDKSTIVIAGADLSHVGRRFGDECELEDPFLADVERGDRAALDALAAANADGFVTCLAQRENSTRVCSAGCIFALMTALPETEPEILRYHQAVDRPSGTCVTCTAAAFWKR